MNRDHDKRLDHLIDQALREYPLDHPPQDLFRKVMGRIEKPAGMEWSRISWFDLTLSGVLALFVGFVLDFLQDVARSPYWSARVRVELIQFWQEIKYFLLHNYQPVMTVVLSSVLVLTLIVVLASVYRRHALYSNRLPA